MIINQNRLSKTLKELDHIVKVYKRDYSVDVKGKRNWRTYEQRLAQRMKMAVKELRPVIKEAFMMIGQPKIKVGKPPKVSTEDKVLIILMKEIFQLSNRQMSNLIMFFSLLTDIDISYKTIERAYSNDLVRMTIHNMFVILIKRKKIEKADISGDGTGYSLTITKHYRNKSKDEGVKEGDKDFVYGFALMDLDTRMYVGYGVSMKSEKDAFNKAMEMMRGIGISVKSARLDKYFSYESIVNEFDPDTCIYIIPKKNATIKGSYKWKKILSKFVNDTFSYLGEYYKRNNSESGFSADKRMCGWKVWQKRPDRIETCLLCKGVWHNLMLIG